MQSQCTAPSTVPSSIPVNNGVVVLQGYGVKVRTANGHLVCEDGFCDERRAARFHRATSGIKRLVVHSDDGYISLDSLVWLHDVGAALVQISDDGEVTLASGPRGCDDPRLRRAQALAAFTDTGEEIVRRLLEAKVEGQIDTLRTMGRCDVADIVARLVKGFGGQHSLDDQRLIEAQAAALYWQVWQDVPLRFARKDVPKIPDHWRTFGPRGSHVSNGPRNATTPANAMLNYLYAILDSETRISLLTYGLDPGIGILHTDQPSVDGLAHDVMEPVRPIIDRWLWQYLQAQTFTRRDFYELERGTVRLAPELRAHLSDNGFAISKQVGRWVEEITGRLAASLSGRVKVPTILTQDHRSDGRSAYRNGQRRVLEVAVTTTARCRGCGSVLSDTRREYCDECLPDVREEAATAFSLAGPESLRSLRAAGADPAHGGKAAEMRAATQTERAARRAEWERGHGDGSAERERFTAEILPRLKEVPLSKIVAGTGLSLRYASLIRRGMYTPHPTYYDELWKLVEVAG